MGEFIKIVAAVIVANWVYFWMVYKAKALIEAAYRREEEDDLWDEFF